MGEWTAPIGSVRNDLYATTVNRFPEVLGAVANIQTCSRISFGMLMCSLSVPVVVWVS